MALNEWEATLTATVADSLLQQVTESSQAHCLQLLSYMYLKAEDVSLQQLLQPTHESLLAASAQEAVVLFALVTPSEGL